MNSENNLTPQIFTLGAIGPKGERVFFFQIRHWDGNDTITLKCEKQQVSAIAEVFEFLLENLPPEYNIPLDEIEPIEPTDSSMPWAVGDLNICYSEEKDQVELIVSELMPPESIDNPLEGREAFEGKMLKLILTREQADGFARMARRVIEMGRPLCPLCGESLRYMPESNFCSCWN